MRKNKQAWIIVATVILIVIIAIVAMVIFDRKNALRAESSQNNITQSLGASIRPFLYKTEPNHECSGDGFSKKCHVSQRMLLGGENVTAMSIEEYFSQNGWLRDDNLSGKNLFTKASSPASSLQSEAHLIRHLNDNETGQAITSRTAIYESREIPKADGQLFQNTGFSYTDEQAYQSIEKEKLSTIFIIYIETDYDNNL